MTSEENVSVEKREERGTRASRRLRRQGRIPAVLYGHGQESMSLSIPAEQVEAVLRHHSHVVNLSGAVTDSALIREVQWDAFGQDVLHLDLIRVDADERVETTVAIAMRGEAPGAKEGGIVKLLVHELEIECPVRSIPDTLEVRINDLHLGDSITAGQLDLPDKVRLLVDENEPIVQCTEPQVEEEAEEGAELAASNEPEVISRREEDEEEEESS